MFSDSRGHSYPYTGSSKPGGFMLKPRKQHSLAVSVVGHPGHSGRCFGRAGTLGFYVEFSQETEG